MTEENITQKFVCPICGKIFPKEDSLNSHMKVHDEKDRDVIKKQKKERIPAGIRGRELALDDPGKLEKNGLVARWVNDTGGRIQKFQRGGYEFVDPNTGVKVGEAGGDQRPGDLGSRISKTVGQDKDGKPIRAYLMAIPKEYYDEDQKLKQAPIDQFENEINTKIHGLNQNKNFYVPEEGQRIVSKRG